MKDETLKHYQTENAVLKKEIKELRVQNKQMRIKTKIIGRYVGLRERVSETIGIIELIKITNLEVKDMNAIQKVLPKLKEIEGKLYDGKKENES